jgi:chromosome segregation ATPase
VNQKLTEELENTRNAIEKLNAEIATSQAQYAHTLEDRTHEFEKSIHEIKLQSQSERKELTGTVSELSQEITALKSELEQVHHENVRWKRSVKVLKVAKEMKEKQFQELVQQLENREKETLEKFVEEKQALHDNYERVFGAVEVQKITPFGNLSTKPLLH